ncbi:MAG: hypothetical protein A3K83_06590 [Omnitrophica WOR_2 bacterium RBG_13_44_8b]|nr:MAG: hypothetical protein A3K83_06590 [Omnitrophica WOR_2 bacterium RBG_13_44_8b]
MTDYEKEEIILTATNQETEGYRIERLNQVVGYICALAEHYGNKDLTGKIRSLDDHKGCLTVVWKAAPTAGEKEIIAKAWESGIANEPAENIVHTIL